MASGNIGDVPAPTYAELLSGPLVDIYVGESKRHWALHKNLLCHHSEHLESELQPGAGKKKSEKLELPDYDPAGFELLVKWLYQGKLDDVSNIPDPQQKYEYAASCHKLYLLCDYFDMPQLKNVAMDQYRKGLNKAELVPDAEEINEIYRKSPSGSPFRRLMTKIAARQIMDPESERDVETYRDCFEGNPDFAVDLVNAIKMGTGGMLFDDPTYGTECEYHDHEAGPNCHIKGKGRTKQALKATAPPRLRAPLLKSSKSEAFAKPDPHPLHPPPPPTHPNQNPPPRQARRQETLGAGPLRRRLTSPASSTVETSTETATGLPTATSPKEQRDKFRKVTPPERRLPSPAPEEESSRTAQDGLLQSSERGSHPRPDSIASEQDDKVGNLASSTSSLDDISPRRGIWGWARVGTGRLGLIGRIPHPEWKDQTSAAKAANPTVNGVSDELESISESRDDFSVPSAIATDPENQDHQEEAAGAKLEGLGISNSTTSPIIASNLTTPSNFAETKSSSDEYAAEADQATPIPPSSKSKNAGSEQGTPTPKSRNKDTPNGIMNNLATPTASPVPKYKIALVSNLLSSPVANTP